MLKLHHLAAGPRSGPGELEPAAHHVPLPANIPGPPDLDHHTRHQHDLIPRHGRQGPPPTFRSSRLPLLAAALFPRNEGMPATPLPALAQDAAGDVTTSSC
jgi:hypothetical protein